MRSLLEFTKEKLITTQLLIGETFDRMDYLIITNFAELGELKEVYTQTSINALQLLWKNFEDNNYLLIEAQIKDDNYFTEKMFDKVKGKYSSVMAVLREIVPDEIPNADFPVGPSTNVPPSQRKRLIDLQRFRFLAMKEEIISINIDDIQDVNKMEDWQTILKRQWGIIEKFHKIVREKYFDMWPDLTYELDYVRYKNMYETTYSLFNFKIDACLYPGVRVIPLIGIPTWRMFDDASDVYAFAVNSVVWHKFHLLGNMMRNSEISEGERRDILIRIFLSYQKYPDETTLETEGYLKELHPFANEAFMRWIK